MRNNARMLQETITPPTILQEAPVPEILTRYRLDGEGTVTQQTYRLLHDLIVNLHLMPNQLLVENEVAACIGTSKTPVREAFIRLAEERLLSIMPQKGSFVTPIDLRRVFEGYFIRQSLESACVRELAGRADAEGLQAASLQVTEQRRALDRGDTDAFYALDNAFHDALFDCAGLSGTKRYVEIAKAEVDRVKSLKSVYRFCRDEEKLYEEHLGILRAIQAGDGDQARDEMANHFVGMNDAIQAIATDERLWRFVNRVNEVSVRSRLPVRGGMRPAGARLSLPNHP